MTSAKSLSERLREYIGYNSDGSRCRPPICTEAADALDQKDELIKSQSAEIGRLVAVTLHCGAQEAEVERLNRLLISEGANRYWETRWRDAATEIALLKEGREVHDEHADHLEHKLAAQSALIAQAAAALENAACAGVKGASEALAAIRKAQP